MRVILAIIFIVCAIDAFADEPAKTPKVLNAPKAAKVQKASKQKLAARRVILGAGIAAVGERANDNRNFEPRSLIALRAGFVSSIQHEFLVEVGGFKQTTGSSGVEIERFHQQIDFWYHHLLFPESIIGHPFLGAAIGAQRDEVSTSFFGQESKSTGAFEAQLSVAGGYRFNLHQNFALWLEGRLATSNNYQPRVLPSFAAFFGFHL